MLSLSGKANNGCFSTSVSRSAQRVGFNSTIKVDNFCQALFVPQLRQNAPFPYLTLSTLSRLANVWLRKFKCTFLGYEPLWSYVGI